MMIGWMTGEGKSWEDRASVREERSRKKCQRGRQKKMILREAVKKAVKLG